MGANDKLAATNYSGEVTPDTDAVRYYYIDAGSNVERYTGTVSPEGLRRSAEFNRWLNQVRAEAWEQGAFAAATSLDHGGHNADNPYKETP